MSKNEKKDSTGMEGTPGAEEKDSSRDTRAEPTISIRGKKKDRGQM